MKQISRDAPEFARKTKVTRKQIFLDEMNRIVPWATLVAWIAPYGPKAGPQSGHLAFAVDGLLRIHFLQQWFNLSDPAMEEALYDTALFRAFAELVWATTGCQTRRQSCAFATYLKNMR